MNFVADGSIQYSSIPSAFPVGSFFFCKEYYYYYYIILLNPNPTLLQPTPEKFLRPELH